MLNKPGFLTSEFWLKVLSMAGTAALSLGFLSNRDFATWQEATSKGGVLVGAFVFMGLMALRYSQQRSDQKMEALKNAAAAASAATGPGGLRQTLVGIVLAAFCVAGPAQAVEPAAPAARGPAVVRTSGLPWRANRDKEHNALKAEVSRLQGLIEGMKGQPAPAPAPIIIQQPAPAPIASPAPAPQIHYYITPPHQILDPSTPPRQILDPRTPPKQILDPNTPPKQILDPVSPPKQILDPKPGPKEILDPAPGPKQILAPEAKPKQDLDPTKPVGPPTGSQSYTRRVAYALARPAK